MDEFTVDQKNAVLSQAQTIRSFITENLINYYWDADATPTTREGMNYQINQVIGQLENLKDQLWRN